MTSDRIGALAQSLVILRCALLRASKDEYGPWPILRGSLRSRLRMTGARIQPRPITV
jgi:hypothetical protein